LRKKLYIRKKMIFLFEYSAWQLGRVHERPLQSPDRGNAVEMRYFDGESGIREKENRGGRRILPPFDA